MWQRLYLGLVMIIVILGVGIYTAPDSNLHIVFCDVGQGDAILVTRGLWQMLVDSGPDAKVLDCIDQHIPFYDRTIELAISTHPELDHAGGFIDVIERYDLKHLFMNQEANTTKSFAQLLDTIQKKQVLVQHLYAFETIRANGVSFETVWPRREFVEQHVASTHDSFQQVLGLRTDGTNLNSFAIVGELVYGNFNLLLTGDADQEVEDEELATRLLNTVEVLKVPHHGSKTGMSQEWLEALKPELAVISVGKKNRYGHPHIQAMELLQHIGAQVKRTDISGTIEVVTDGEKWWVNE